MSDSECPNLYFSTANPFRSPDWAWNRAEWQAKSPRRKGTKRNPRDTDWTCQARDHIAVTAPDPAIAEALSLYSAGGLTRGELEARILAGQPPAEIAVRMQISPASLAAFEALFFDVRPRLKHPSFIQHLVLRSRGLDHMQVDNVELLWKSYGYWYGVELLELLVTAATREMLNADGVLAYFHPTSQLPPDLLFMIAAHCSPITLAGVLQGHLLYKLWQRQRQDQALLPEFATLARVILDPKRQPAEIAGMNQETLAAQDKSPALIEAA